MMKKILSFSRFFPYKNLLALLLSALCFNTFAQPIYKEFKNSDGEVKYRYSDGYTILKKDFDESERLIKSSADKWRNKDYSGTLRDLEEAVRLNQKNYNAWYCRGKLKDGGNNDHDGAIADYTKAIELYPKFDIAWSERGWAKSKKGDYDGSIADYTEAIRLKPDVAILWSNRGWAKGKKGDYDGTIADYTEAIRLKPDVANFWSNRGWAKSGKGDHDDSIADYTEAIRLKSDDEDLWYNRGWEKYRKGDYDGSIADYTKAIRLNSHTLFWSSRGWAKEKKGQLEEAIKDYKKALEIDPRNEFAQRSLREAEAKFVTQRLQRQPTVHVLAVGIGRYQQDYMFSPLEFAVPGAYQVKNLFERRGLTNCVTLFNDSKARRSAIRDSLEALTNSKRVQPDDLVIFYFSGHGLFAGGKLGICPYDYQTSADLIEDRTITEILNRCPARHKICLIEACKNETSSDVLDPAEVRRFNESRRGITSGVVYMTSTEVGKKSWGSTDGGYFTLAIIEGLDEGKADTNGDHTVTAQELFNYAKKSVSIRTNSQQVPQINSGYPQSLEVMRLPRN